MTDTQMKMLPDKLKIEATKRNVIEENLKMTEFKLKEAN